MADMVEKGPYGARIRQIRERRKLSQADFAELAGVTARAQRNYESGLRTPNIAYLAMLAIADVDIGYILSGIESRWLEKADADAFAWLSEHLGLPFTFQVEVSQVIAMFRRGEIDDQEKRRRLSLALTQYRIGVLDAELLTGILVSIEAQAPALSGRKKAGIAALLYRAFRSSGQIDDVAVREAVALAS